MSVRAVLLPVDVQFPKGASTPNSESGASRDYGGHLRFFAAALTCFKAKAMEAAIKKCASCAVLEYVDSRIAESSRCMPQLTTTPLQKYGDRWTHALAINDLYFDFMGP
jgi:hypothetical protein